MKKLLWTRHSRDKMRFYNLSEGRVRRIINAPHRMELGIAPDTIAVMQILKAKRPTEIWVMLQEAKQKRIVISAWRYPGITKPGEPLPKEIIEEMKSSAIRGLSESLQ